MKKVTYHSFRSALYGVFVLYVFGMAFWIDNSLAYQAKQKKSKEICKTAKCCKPKKKCCDKTESCPATPPIKQETPCQPHCPCKTQKSASPFQVIRSNDNIVAYQNFFKIKDKTTFWKNAVPTSVNYEVNKLPTPTLPTQAGKEKLKWFCIWQT